MNKKDHTGERTQRSYHVLRCIILVYDFLRLLLLVRMVSTFAPAIGEPGDKVLPYVALMAPHTLFPLASFFLWVNLRAYAAYISLYVTGKIIGIGAFIAWAVLSWNFVIASMGMNIMDTIWTLGLTVILFFADIGTILGVFALYKALSRMSDNVPVKASESGGI